MIKSIFAGALLFIAMVCTALVVSHSVANVEGVPGFISGNSGGYPGGYPGGYSASGQINAHPHPGFAIDGSSTRVNTAGEGGGLEDNPFVIAFGLTFILSFAIGFWKYHQILEERRATEEAAKSAECRTGQCNRSGGKEIRL